MWNAQYGLAASHICMKISGACEVPRRCGWVGLSARSWWRLMASQGIMEFMVSSGSSVIEAISCDVRQPSKKWTTGNDAFKAMMCDINARSCASCTEWEFIMMQLVCRVAITLSVPQINHMRLTTWVLPVDDGRVV